MKLAMQSNTLLSFLLSVATWCAPQEANAYQQPADIYYHKQESLGPAIWSFGAGGIKIYSPDGSKMLKHLPNTDICNLVVDSEGEPNQDCFYFDVQSDGQRYVWATNLQGAHSVDVFSIDSGDYVGSLPTCNSPLTLDYNPYREEMWVRCAEPDDSQEERGYIDVFSVNALSTDHKQVHFYENGENLRSYGRHVIHPSMGDFGYATVSNQPFLYKLDQSSKAVVGQFELPDSYGAYDMAYSPVNKHVYLRARVCCTCGSAESDSLSCGWYSAKPVNVTTGPSAGTNVDGVCGATCEGTVADTIGVHEFDTISGQFVATHNIKAGTGYGADPRPSPDGSLIFLVGNDGGQNVRVLQPGLNGQKSSFLFDVPVDFVGATSDSSQVIADYAVIEDDKRKIAVFASTSDNKVVLADLNSNPVKTHSLQLTDNSESTAGSSRHVEWVVDTNWVWIGGASEHEQYILDVGNGSTLTNAKIVRTVSGVTSTTLLYVENYAEKAMLQKLGARLQDEVALQAAELQDDSDDNGTAVAGLAIGIVALVMSLAALGLIFSKPSPQVDTKKAEAAHDGTKSLGSKQVH